jgi:putative DNA primase/helicase
MSVQILGIRYFKDKERKAETFFKENWRAPTVPELFKDMEKFIEPIPQNQRYNLYYTVSECHEEKGRKLKSQNIIPYDIDGMDMSRYQEYIDPILFAIGNLNYNEVGIVNSGNGLQFLVGTDQPITDTEYFDKTRKHYKIICDRINNELSARNLPGDADSSVWSPARLMRLPFTINNKTPDTGYANKNSIKEAILLQRIIVPQPGYNVVDAAGLPEVMKEDHVNVDALKRFPDPDSKAVLSECEFLKWCGTNQADVNEENWYKMLSITSRLENGAELSHNYSEQHPGYTHAETEMKIEHAQTASGPRTCKNIEKSFDKCKGCKHYGKLLSPILIKGADWISTKSTGFRNIRLDKNGNPIPGKPNYDDLVKYFKQLHDFIVTPAKMVYIWRDTHWEEVTDNKIENFVEQHVLPSPTHSECVEFRQKIQRNNLVEETFFNDSTFKKINLKNGILDLSGDKPVLTDHSQEAGFTSVLPYEYDPSAKCKRFDKFMDEVTLNIEEYKEILLEYAGYAFANENCTLAKCLVLYGDGKNGKSTFMNVLKSLAGKDSFSSVSLNQLENPQYVALLNNKLFNITEETPTRTFCDSSTFKNLVSGGDIMVKVVYKPPFVVPNRAKLIMATNDLPWMHDTSYGMMRRLLIVPFNNRFEGKLEDKDIELKLWNERPGILNAIIKAYYNMRQRGRFLDSKKVQAQVVEYQRDNDEVFQFVEAALDITEINQEKFVPAMEVYTKFKTYCERSGIRNVPPANRFQRKLTHVVKDLKERRHRKGKNKTSVYLGMEFTENYEF